MCCSNRIPAVDPTSADHQPPGKENHKPCCADCAKEHAATETAGRLDTTPRHVPEIVYRTLYTSGRPLDHATRRLMEARLHADLSDIRIHVDSRAAESAEAIGALAYSFGNHIVFGPGMYLPQDLAGRRILVHELVHNLQQVASWSQRGVWPEQMIESAYDALETEAEAIALGAMHHPFGPRIVSEAPLHLACLGANPDCTQGQREVIHQAIFNANAWVNNALKKLTATPMPAIVRSALRRNFGNTYGVTANLQLFIERIRRARSVMNRIPMGCNSTAPECVARHCGFANGAGSLSVTICTVTLEAGVNVRMPARCVLHESFHAAFTRFTVDSYSTGHGTSASTPGYPGAGIDPLLNADSYTTLVMDLS